MNTPTVILDKKETLSQQPLRAANKLLVATLNFQKTVRGILKSTKISLSDFTKENADPLTGLPVKSFLETEGARDMITQMKHPKLAMSDVVELKNCNLVDPMFADALIKTFADTAKEYESRGILTFRGGAGGSDEFYHLYEESKHGLFLRMQESFEIKRTAMIASLSPEMRERLFGEVKARKIRKNLNHEIIHSVKEMPEEDFEHHYRRVTGKLVDMYEQDALDALPFDQLVSAEDQATFRAEAKRISITRGIPEEMIFTNLLYRKAIEEKRKQSLASNTLRPGGVVYVHGLCKLGTESFTSQIKRKIALLQGALSTTKQSGKITAHTKLKSNTGNLTETAPSNEIAKIRNELQALQVLLPSSKEPDSHSLHLEGFASDTPVQVIACDLQLSAINNITLQNFDSYSAADTFIVNILTSFTDAVKSGRIIPHYRMRIWQSGGNIRIYLQPREKISESQLQSSLSLLKLKMKDTYFTTFSDIFTQNSKELQHLMLHSSSETIARKKRLISEDLDIENYSLTL